MLPKTLRGKFTLVYVGLAMLALLVGLAGIWNLSRLVRSVDNLMTSNYKSIDAVSHMMECIERQDSGMLILMGVDKNTGLDLFTRYGNEFLEWFGIEKGNVTESGEYDVIDALDSKYVEYQKMIYAMQDELARGAGSAQRYYSGTVLPMVDAIKADCRELITINEQAMFRSKQHTADDARRSMFVLLAVTLATVIGGYVAARYFILLFLRPVKMLSDGIARVREGDLDQHVDVRSNDEAGKLASEFNSMTRRLQEYERSSLGSLMAEQKKSDAIVRSISDPLLVLDAGWRIVLVNDASGRFFDLDAKAVASRHFLEAIPNGELFAAIEKLAATSSDAEGRIIRIHKGEEDYYFNLTVTRMNDPDNRIAGVIAALQDVTGLKELERVRTDFLAAISHEFKTPLTSIMMAASMLRESSFGALTADQAETVETIRMDGERLLGLVNELLELMKIESGREIYRIEPCDALAIAEAALRGFAEAARRQGVLIRNTMGEGLPTVMADFEKIRWVLNNLIGNALKHTAQGDTITVSALADSRFVSVSVTDTGEGIPPEFLERIFDRFVQVQSGGIDVSGTGLGLSVCKEIIQGHGGSIRVNSEEGRGSTFTFTLPRAEGV